jgi:hypothetical protein
MYAFNFICVAIVLLGIFRSAKVRALFPRLPLLAQIVIVFAAFSVLLGVSNAFEETKFAEAALLGSTAWFLHGMIVLVSLGGGVWLGEKISDKLQYKAKYLGIVLGFCTAIAFIFLAGVTLKFVFTKIPGIGWRLENQMSYTGANNSFNPTAGVGLVISNQLGPASG